MAGGRYRVGGMTIEATTVDRVPVGSITDEDARRAGAADRSALLARLGVDEDATVWRVEFRHLGADERAVLSDQDVTADEVAAIRA